MARIFRISLPLLLLVLVLLSCPAAADTGNGALPAGEVAIRQAHMDLVAYTRECEMRAAIDYISPLRMTDTARLTALLSGFKDQEARIPEASTREEFENITRQMRSITGEFRNETALQMEKGYGKPNDLALAIRTSTINNPYIEQRRAAYWTVRRTSQLAEFDSYAGSAQASLDTLQARGYPVESAQRALDVLVSRRPLLQSALDAKSEERIISAGDVILPLSEDLGEETARSQEQVSEAEKMQFYVDQGYRIAYRADALNMELTRALLDIGPAEDTTRRLKQDLSLASRLLGTGSLGLAKNPMTLVKKDIKDLSMDYRDLASSADLPPDLSATLRTLVVSLNNAADSMEGY